MPFVEKLLGYKSVSFVGMEKNAGKTQTGDIDGVINQYINTVKTMHGIYVEPTKKYADIIINGGKNKTALDVVAARIQKRLSQEG